MERGDEIGQLADAFSHMSEAIATREAHISELAYRDALTGLPNRAFFTERLQDGVASAGKCGEPLAVLTLDMDRFKMVNDALGHDLGDLLLIEVGKRLRRRSATRAIRSCAWAATNSRCFCPVRMRAWHAASRCASRMRSTGR
jgi:PleD family two-component response regulator